MIMLEEVTARLASFSYEVNESDVWLLDFIIKKVEDRIKFECNLDTIPEGLYNIAVDMVTGEFLLGKKSTGQLKGLDVPAAVKQIQEGDTNITYSAGGGKTPEQRLDELILYLMSYGKESFAAFRCLKW